MATISNQLGPIDVYFFNAVGNSFVRKETTTIPLPARFVSCAPGPDGLMRVYSKVIPIGIHPPQEFYVGQSVSQLEALSKNA